MKWPRGIVGNNNSQFLIIIHGGKWATSLRIIKLIYTKDHSLIHLWELRELLRSVPTLSSCAPSKHAEKRLARSRQQPVRLAWDRLQWDRSANWAREAWKVKVLELIILSIWAQYCAYVRQTFPHPGGHPGCVKQGKHASRVLIIPYPVKGLELMY